MSTFEHNRKQLQNPKIRVTLNPQIARLVGLQTQIARLVGVQTQIARSLQF